MKIYEYPLIDDGALPEIKIKQLKDYLYKLTDELNYNASLTSASGVFKEAAEGLKISPMAFDELETRENQELVRNILSFVMLMLENENTALYKKIKSLENEIRKLKGE